MTTVEETATREWSATTVELGDKIVNLTGLQAQELSDYIKDVHGIEPASGGAVMVAASGSGDDDDDAAVDTGPSTFDVVLTAAGQKKIQVIKALRAITGKTLKEAKGLADATPSVIKENVSEDEANEVKTKLEEAGGEVELKGK